MSALNGHPATNGWARRVMSDRERLRALEEAVRAHKLVTGNLSVPRRPADHDLYRKLG